MNSGGPCPGAPYPSNIARGSLCRKFKVTTIPTLILLDSCNAHVLTKNGVAMVTEDPHGLEFPWAPKTFAQTIAGPLIRPLGEMTDYGVLGDAHIGLYFSANWCPPCKAFTPLLCETYRRVREAGKKFEIIFVSSDRSEESFQQYFGEMPWLAVPYADTQRRESLGKLYSIQGIPSLILLDPGGHLITSTGRVALLDDRLGLRFPWEPAALSQLSPTNAELLNQEPALVLFVDSNEDEELGPVRQMLQPIAEKIVAESKANGEEQPLHFFYAGEDDMADSIRDFTSLPDCAPLLAILDVPARAKFVKDAEELSPSVVQEFLQDYLQGRLEAEPI
uniref:nucleoredoxin isoform X2 n=1 Tax=Myxine glutinosa TaxID=7769 RepID=UPI00358FAD39